MENASKALLMAAEVLIGVLTISLMIYWFNHFADFGSSVNDEMNDKEINEFNASFIKYETDTSDPESYINAHDVSTIINLAKNSNAKYEYDTSSRPGTVNNPVGKYIFIIVKDKLDHEKHINESQGDIEEFINDNYKVTGGTFINTKYDCEIFIDQNTKLVWKVICKEK